MTPAATKVAKSLVHLSTEGFPKPEGLGVLCGSWIFTCAHYFEYLPISLRDTPWLHAWRVGTQTCGTFAMLYGSTMDFMILAPDGMTVESSEAGGTESSWDVIAEAEECDAILSPAELSFVSGAEQAQIRGFFFSREGTAIHEATFEVHRDSGFVTFHSDDAIKGCSGGPLCTEDGKVFGIYTNSSREPLPGQTLRHCVGRRIDLCIPRLLYPQINWNRLDL